MSTIVPPILGTTGTISEIYDFAATETKKLQISLGAQSTGAGDIDVEVRNLTQNTLLDTISFTGLTASETIVSTALDISGNAGDKIGLVTTQTTSGWMWSDFDVQPSITTSMVKSNDNVILVSDGTQLEYFDGTWKAVPNVPVGTVIDAIAVDLTTENFYVLDKTAGILWLVTQTGAWSDITNGLDITNLNQIAGKDETRIVLAGTAGATAAWNGTAWITPTFSSHDINGIDMASDGSVWTYNYRGQRGILRPTGTSWISFGTYGDFIQWVTFAPEQASGTGGQDKFFMDNSNSSIHGANQERLGNDNIGIISYDSVYADISGGYWYKGYEHIIENGLHKRVVGSTDVTFSNASVMEVVPTDGPHVYNAVRETILRPDAGPHVYNAVRETIFGEIKEPEGVYIKAQFTDVVMAPLPGPSIKAHFTDIVMAPSPGPNIKAQFTDVVMKKMPTATIQKQSVSVVIKPPPPEMKVQKQSVSVVVKKKPPGPHVKHLISEAVLKPDPGPHVRHLISEAVLKPDPGPHVRHLISEVVLKKQETKLHWQQAAVLIQPGYGKVKLHKQQIAAVIQPPPAETFLHWQQAAVVAQPDKTYVRLHQQQIAVVVMPNPRPKRRMGSMQLVTIKGTR